MMTDLNRNSGTTAIHLGDYTAAEWEFIRAVDAARKASGKRYLTATDYLAVLLSLGYRKAEG